MFDIIPENGIEDTILSDPRIIQGLDSGKPRKHHPEGKVGIHVKQILEYIDMQTWNAYRSDLRMIALIHDTFKNTKDGNGRRHAVMAYKYSLELPIKPHVSQIILHHDTGWYLFKEWKRTRRFDECEFRELYSETDLELMIRFNYADLCTRGKEKVIWFENMVHELALPNAPKKLIYGTLLS